MVTPITLPRHEIKARLGHGGARRIARKLECSEQLVSAVLNQRMHNRRVAVAIARAIRVKLEDLPPAMYERATAASTAA